MITTHRFLAILLAAAAGLLPAAAADAAFPGRNGAVARGWWSTDVRWLGDVEADHFERAIRLGGRTLYGCETFVPFATEPPFDTPDACGGARYGDPAFSPDGERIVFDAGPALAVLGVEDGSFTPLPAHAGDDSLPAFSPTGRRIVFTSTAEPTSASPAWDLWVSDDHGLHARLLVRDGSRAEWSTRNWIAFVRDGSIHRVRPDGSGPRLLARDAYAPAWSPDGTQLAFVRFAHRRAGRQTRGGIFIARADGSRAHRLTGGAAQEGFVGDVAWSPDGRRLLIESDNGLVATDLEGRSVAFKGRGPAYGADYDVEHPGFDWRPLPDATGPRR